LSILRKPIFGPRKQRRGTGTLEPTHFLEEVEEAIKSMKPGKAAGPYDIPADLLELGEYNVYLIPVRRCWIR